MSKLQNQTGTMPLGKRISVREMLARLVAFPTVSDRSNLDLIEFVREYLAGHGVQSHLVPSDDGTKANLFATVGPMVPGGVVLSGHTDVVPVAGQAWASDPFELVERNGRLYGRGTADMKAFSAIGLALVPEMLEAGLRRPVHFALSYDEEVGCIGAPRMIDAMVARLPAPMAVIVGEPSSMKLATGHKGFLGLATTVRGHPVHAHRVHKGVSAVMVAARLITFLEDMMRENRAEAIATPRQDIAEFDPPWTTLHTGQVNGGTAHNIVAQSCRFVTDIRNVPGDDPRDFYLRYMRYIRDMIEPAMQAIHPETGVQVDFFAEVPGFLPEVSSDGQGITNPGAAEALVRRLTGENDSSIVQYGSEAGQFQAVGMSTVICGPGSIEQAHEPDEYISVAQLEAGVSFMRRLVVELSA